MDDLYDLDYSNYADLIPLISDDVVVSTLRRIYNENFDPQNEIEENLFDHTWSILNEATDKGFGKIEYGHPDFEFLQEVKYNNAVFAAFKTHRQQNDLFVQLTDDKGVPKSFAQFKKDSEPIIGRYNVDWLQTEYNTALIRARTAVQFKQFEREAHIYPNLKWLPSMAAIPREGHKPFYNRVWAQSDPFWRSHRPGDEWGCKCGITSTDEPVTDGVISTQEMPEASPGLDNNPAEDGKLFSNTHPYVKDGYGSLKKRRKLAELTADSAVIKAWAEEIIETRKPKGVTKEVGTLDKAVLKFLKKEKIHPANRQIVLSDSALNHMLRDVKKHPLAPVDIAKIKGYLQTAETYFDAGKKNILFIVDKENGKSLKIVVQPNYKCKINGEKVEVNYVTTSGYIETYNKVANGYKKIKV